MKKTIAIVLTVLLALVAFTSCQNKSAGADAIDTYVAYNEAQKAFYSVKYNQGSNSTLDLSKEADYSTFKNYMYSLRSTIEEILEAENSKLESYNFNFDFGTTAKGTVTYSSERTATSSTSKSSASGVEINYSYSATPYSNPTGESITGKGTLTYSYNEEYSSVTTPSSDGKTFTGSQKRTMDITLNGKKYATTVKTREGSGNADGSNITYTKDSLTYGGVEVDKRLLKSNSTY